MESASGAPSTWTPKSPATIHLAVHEPPDKNPFAGGGNAAKSHHELYAQTVRCLDTGKASCLGPFIHLSHFTTMQTASPTVYRIIL